jgi:hypothetical protein
MILETHGVADTRAPEDAHRNGAIRDLQASSSSTRARKRSCLATRTNAASSAVNDVRAKGPPAALRRCAGAGLL